MSMNRNDDRPVSVMGIIGMIVAGIAALAVVIVAIIGIVIQHEAIQAQEAIANSGRNNTVIYVPSGPNGVPIQVTDPAAIAGQDKATSPG